MPSQTPSVPDRPRLRAGDADRDATLTVIQDAFVNGRLTPAEVAERQDRALTSQYTDELLPIVADLPEASALASRFATVMPHASAPAPARPDGQPRYVILTGRTYDLEPGQTSINNVAIMGGDTIHTAPAFGPGVTVHLHLDAIMGGHTLLVPPGVKVVDESQGIMGGNDVSKHARGDGSNGVLLLTGTLFMAGSTVKLDKAFR